MPCALFYFPTVQPGHPSMVRFRHNTTLVKVCERLYTMMSTWKRRLGLDIYYSFSRYLLAASQALKQPDVFWHFPENNHGQLNWVVEFCFNFEDIGEAEVEQENRLKILGTNIRSYHDHHHPGKNKKEKKEKHRKGSAFLRKVKRAKFIGGLKILLTCTEVQ